MDEQALADIIRNFETKSLGEARIWADRQGTSELGYEFRKWIAAQEEIERKEREAEQRHMAEQAIAAAKLSAETSRDAAIASMRSARWTMWAAVAAFMGVLVTVAQAYGWIPKA